MKTKKVFSLILALATLLCAVIIPANAKETKTHNHIEIYIEGNNISEETKEKAINFYTNGGEEKEGVATYGLTCTLLGHKLESTIIKTITHKVRSTSPRCLEKKYNYEACTRCDYESSTLLTSFYIACC